MSKTDTVRTNRINKLKRIRIIAVVGLVMWGIIIALPVLYVHNRCWFGLFNSPDVADLTMEGDILPFTRLEKPGLRLKTPVKKGDKLKLRVTMEMTEECHCSDSNIYVSMKNTKSNIEDTGSRGSLEFESRNGTQVTWHGIWNTPSIAGTYQVETGLLCLGSATNFYDFLFVELDLVD